jgi:hypothetical protein
MTTRVRSRNNNYTVLDKGTGKHVRVTSQKWERFEIAPPADPDLEMMDEAIADQHSLPCCEAGLYGKCPLYIQIHATYNPDAEKTAKENAEKNRSKSSKRG